MRYGNIEFAENSKLGEIESDILEIGLIKGFIREVGDANISFEDFVDAKMKEDMRFVLSEDQWIKDRYDEEIANRLHFHEFYQGKIDEHKDELRKKLENCDLETVGKFLRAREESYKEKQSSPKENDSQEYVMQCSDQIQATVEAQSMVKTLDGKTK